MMNLVVVKNVAPPSSRQAGWKPALQGLRAFAPSASEEAG